MYNERMHSKGVSPIIINVTGWDAFPLPRNKKEN
jgi:hypothetical protein